MLWIERMLRINQASRNTRNPECVCGLRNHLPRARTVSAKRLINEPVASRKRSYRLHVRARSNQCVDHSGVVDAIDRRVKSKIQVESNTVPPHLFFTSRGAPR